MLKEERGCYISHSVQGKAQVYGTTELEMAKDDDDDMMIMMMMMTMMMKMRTQQDFQKETETHSNRYVLTIIPPLTAKENATIYYTHGYKFHQPRYNFELLGPSITHKL